MGTKKPNRQSILLCQKEMMNSVQNFQNLLSDDIDNEMKLRLLATLGIGFK
jgi:hypothetical protein